MPRIDTSMRVVSTPVGAWRRSVTRKLELRGAFVGALGRSFLHFVEWESESELVIPRELRAG